MIVYTAVDARHIHHDKNVWLFNNIAVCLCFETEHCSVIEHVDFMVLFRIIINKDL